MEAMRYTLLICSVGGDEGPVVASMRHWRPERVLFIPSTDTKDIVERALGQYQKCIGQLLSPGQYSTILVDDAQDLSGCLRRVRVLDQEVDDWLGRGKDFRVVADFTAGTKCLSVALALQARRWPCEFSYVGGRSRTKDGVGNVITGSEQVVHSANPWDALGFQAIEQCIAVFNHGGYAAAAGLLDDAMGNLSDPGVKRTLGTLKALVQAYASWDRFDHRAAVQHFESTLKNSNDLAVIFTDPQSMGARLDRHYRQVRQLADMKAPTRLLVEDLWHNAHRRASERRYDDAVARLYRACEALAQVRLSEEYGILDTKRVCLDQLPSSLRDEWVSRSRDHAPYIGLQGAYRLLRELGDDLGARFTALELDGDQRSPLVARNQSILAHGFQTVGERVFESLSEKLCQLGAFPQALPDDWRLPTAGGISHAR
jgi:CRISPR-associated protein (TIGR02710 family)